MKSADLFVFVVVVADTAEVTGAKRKVDSGEEVKDGTSPEKKAKISQEEVDGEKEATNGEAEVVA